MPTLATATATVDTERKVALKELLLFANCLGLVFCAVYALAAALCGWFEMSG